MINYLEKQRRARNITAEEPKAMTVQVLTEK
jgi:hypothetical protein